MSREALGPNIDALKIDLMESSLQRDELIGSVSFTMAPETISPDLLADSQPRKNRRLGLKGTLAAGLALNIAALTPGAVFGQEQNPSESPVPSPIASINPETALNPEDCPIDETQIATQPGTGDVNFDPASNAAEATPSEAPTSEVSADTVLTASVDINGDGILDEADILTDTNGDSVIDVNDITTDVDGDGDIDGDDLTAALDTNGDGVVDENDQTAANQDCDPVPTGPGPDSYLTVLDSKINKKAKIKQVYSLVNKIYANEDYKEHLKGLAASYDPENTIITKKDIVDSLNECRDAGDFASGASACSGVMLQFIHGAQQFPLDSGDPVQIQLNEDFIKAATTLRSAVINASMPQEMLDGQLKNKAESKGLK